MLLYTQALFTSIFETANLLWKPYSGYPVYFYQQIKLPYNLFLMCLVYLNFFFSQNIMIDPAGGKTNKQSILLLMGAASWRKCHS